MYTNKPSVTKTEAADRVNLLHSTSCRFEQYQFRKLGQMLLSLLRYAPFHDSHQKNSCFQTQKLNIRSLYLTNIDFKTTSHVASGST